MSTHAHTCRASNSALRAPAADADAATDSSRSAASLETQPITTPPTSIPYSLHFLPSATGRPGPRTWPAWRFAWRGFARWPAPPRWTAGTKPSNHPGQGGAVPADGPPPIALELPPAAMLGGLISLGALLDARVAGVGEDQMDTTDMDTDAMASWLAFCAPCGRTAAASRSRAPETASRRTGSGRSCTGNNSRSQHGGAHRHLLALSAYLHDDVLEVVHVDPFPLVRAPQLDGLSGQLGQQLLRAGQVHVVGGQVANTATINDIISTTIIITTTTTAFTILILVLLQLLIHLLLFLIY